MTTASQRANGAGVLSALGAVPAVGFALLIIVLAAAAPEPDGVVPILLTTGVAVFLTATPATVVSVLGGRVPPGVRVAAALAMAVVLGFTLALPQSMSALGVPWWGPLAWPMGLGEGLIILGLVATSRPSPTRPV